ncbi:MAG: FAD-binding oxidoreductase [Firmicutes bacterium HGW-Firmicutes-12]|nr:MAG: FAD-binding oxidoreductase [Firmicutes bacterium HGW-Firmicutes-12]
MKLVAGNMLWTSIDKIPNKYTYLSDHVECDALIIGGGISGAITAYYYTKAGINTVLVDKNIIGYGSTRASTSILQYEIDTDLLGLIGMKGVDNAVKCFKLCENAVYEIERIVKEEQFDCDFSLKECFYYTANSSEISFMRKECEARKEHGFAVEFLDKESAKERFSFNVEGGIYSNAGAAQINPYRFNRLLISKAVENGLKVFENTEISNIYPHDNNVSLVTNNDFKITAKKVVIATGYEARRQIKEKIINFSRTFTIVTKPVKSFDGWYNKCLIRDYNNPYIYLRTTGDDRIIIGGEDEKIGGEDSNMSNLSGDNLVSTMKYETLQQKLGSLFPLIKDVEIEYKFNGLFGETKDGLPYIGEYQGHPNCYFTLGYGANGILYTIIGGQLLRELFLGNRKPELELFKFNR